MKKKRLFEIFVIPIDLTLNFLLAFTKSFTSACVGFIFGSCLSSKGSLGPYRTMVPWSSVSLAPKRTVSCRQRPARIFCRNISWSLDFGMEFSDPSGLSHKSGECHQFRARTVLGLWGNSHTSNLRHYFVVTAKKGDGPPIL